MNDGIIRGTGNSRYLKTVSEALALYPTYEDFMRAFIAGTLPVDFNGINTDGWTQIGTALNKANLLSDQTAARYPAGTETVNAALAALPGMIEEAGQHYVLLKEVTDPGGTSQIDVDISDMDISEYAFVDIVIRNCITDLGSNSTQVNCKFNNTDTYCYERVSYGSYSSNASSNSDVACNFLDMGYASGGDSLGGYVKIRLQNTDFGILYDYMYFVRNAITPSSTTAKMIRSMQSYDFCFIAPEVITCENLKTLNIYPNSSEYRFLQGTNIKIWGAKK